MKKDIPETVTTMMVDLKNNLKSIREVGGWNATEFANMVQLSRQTLWKLENDPNAHMLPVQYIAIRHVLDYQIQSHPDEAVRTKLNTLVNLALEHEEISEKDKERAIAYVRGTKNKGFSKKEFEVGLKSLLVGVSVGAIITGVAMWLTKIIKH